MKNFDLFRKRDINVEAAISDKEEELTFHIFSDGALNTFSPTLASEVEKLGKWTILERKKIKTQTVASILDRHLPDSKQKIDFMSIDIEGHDLKALQSNDWNKYRPYILLIESHNFSLSEADSNLSYQFLKKQDYKLIAKSLNTIFFIDERMISNDK